MSDVHGRYYTLKIPSHSNYLPDLVLALYLHQYEGRTHEIEMIFDQRTYLLGPGALKEIARMTSSVAEELDMEKMEGLL